MPDARAITCLLATIGTTTATSTAAIATTTTNTTTTLNTTAICFLQHQLLFTISYSINNYNIYDHTMIAAITSLHVDCIQCMCIAHDIYVCIYA